jgi:hypothetical protein
MRHDGTDTGCAGAAACRIARRGARWTALALAGLLTVAAPAMAQAPKAPDPKPAPAAAPQAALPDAEGIVLLIRTTLITLNDAVQTGNFTALRDRAAPGFREANSAARLGVIFAGLAQRGVDLAAVAILAPQLDRAPAIDPKSGMLNIKGHFPGQPVRIDFEILFQPVGGRWRVFGLSVNPVSTAPAAAAPPPARAPEKEAAAKAKPAKK